MSHKKDPTTGSHSSRVLNGFQNFEPFTDTGIPILPDYIRKQLQNGLCNKMERLVFRRVVRINTKPRDLYEVCYHTNTDGRSSSCKIFNPKDFCEKNFTRDEYNRNLEFKYHNFFAFTSDRTLRNNDPYRGETIFLASNKYSQFDITEGYTFKFSKKRNMTNTVPPRIGDLVCILVGNPTYKHEYLEAKSWFTCSEQFLRAWTLLMYNKHHSFESRGKEPRMRERYMSGNRLNTNSFLKFVLAHRQTQTIIPNRQAVKRYYRMRTEYVSRRWCHIYAALVLMIRYGEIPCRQNIPSNRGGGPNCIQWNLPKMFVKLLLSKYTTYDPKIHKINWHQLIDLTRQTTTSLRKKAPKTKKQSHDRNHSVLNHQGFELTTSLFPSLPHHQSSPPDNRCSQIKKNDFTWAAIVTKNKDVCTFVEKTKKEPPRLEIPQWSFPVDIMVHSGEKWGDIADNEMNIWEQNEIIKSDICHEKPYTKIVDTMQHLRVGETTE